MVSCQKGPTCHAYAWQIGPFWQDTLDKRYSNKGLYVIPCLHQVQVSSHIQQTSLKTATDLEKHAGDISI